MSQNKTAELYAYDSNFRSEKIQYICGVDEAGRGPLCGPVSVAAVILDPDSIIEGLNDSKKLSEKKREELYPVIQEKALAYAVVFVSPQEIDRLNILRATLLGMETAIKELSLQPNLALIDGNQYPEATVPCQCITKGDFFSASIAAASILAKVARDRYMQELDKEFPEYGLAQHKGYPTKMHYERIAEYGIQDFYRRSFLKKRGLV